MKYSSQDVWKILNDICPDYDRKRMKLIGDLNVPEDIIAANEQNFVEVIRYSNIDPSLYQSMGTITSLIPPSNDPTVDATEYMFSDPTNRVLCMYSDPYARVGLLACLIYFLAEHNNRKEVRWTPGQILYFSTVELQTLYFMAREGKTDHSADQIKYILSNVRCLILDDLGLAIPKLDYYRWLQEIVHNRFRNSRYLSVGCKPTFYEDEKWVEVSSFIPQDSFDIRIMDAIEDDE